MSSLSRSNAADPAPDARNCAPLAPPTADDRPDEPPRRSPWADLQVRWLGALAVQDAIAENLAVSAAVAQGQAPQLLLFEPIAPVYTLGLRAQTPAGRDSLLQTLAFCRSRGVDILDVERGGLGTLHAPGQLVVFCAVPAHRTELRRIVARLLETAAQIAVPLGLEARADLERDVGLWSPRGKLASLGLWHAQGVVRHGMSLNLHVDLSLTPGLVLCGSQQTRLANLGDAPGAREMPVRELAAQFSQLALLWP